MEVILPCCTNTGLSAQVYLEDVYNVSHYTWLNSDGPLTDATNGMEWQWLMSMTYYITRCWLQSKLRYLVIDDTAPAVDGGNSGSVDYGTPV